MRRLPDGITRHSTKVVKAGHQHQTCCSQGGRIQKLSSVNREKGTLYIIKILNKESEYEGTFYAGYPLQVGSKAVLEIDNKDKIVFFAHPSPKAKAEKDHAWAQKFDQKKLVTFLRKGSKAVMSAISHRNTVTKDTFMLTGFSDALSELEKRCKLN